MDGGRLSNGTREASIPVPSPTTCGHQPTAQTYEAYADSNTPADSLQADPSPQVQAELAERTLRNAIKANFPQGVIEQLRAATEESKQAAEAAETLPQRIAEAEGEVASWAKKFLEATALYDQRLALCETEAKRLQAEADEACKPKHEAGTGHANAKERLETLRAEQSRPSPPSPRAKALSTPPREQP